MCYALGNDGGKNVKVHLGSRSRISEGTVSQASWEVLEPYLNTAFVIQPDEKIAEIQPTRNGIKARIEKI